jgi:ABC-type sulfate transport system permease component
MSFRRRAAKPSMALWMLVAIGDVALILAGLGMTALIALASVVTVAVAAAGAWLLMRHSVPGRDTVSTPVAVPMTSRRRA